MQLFTACHRFEITPLSHDPIRAAAADREKGLEYLMELTEFGNFEYPSLTAEELIKAKAHLYKSLQIIEQQLNGIVQGIYNALLTSTELAEGWLEVNKCRIYTENIAAFEEYLQPAMGLINDAKLMVDHLAAKKLGLTRHGRISILQSLNEARALIILVVNELEYWDRTEGGEEVPEG